MIIKLNKMFRDWNSNKFRVLEKEIIMSILGFFFLFIAIYFYFEIHNIKYFLFFVFAFGILTFLFFVPLLKLGFNSKNEIISTEEKSFENNRIQNVDIVTNVLINDFSQHNFTENNYIQNVDEITNVLINDISQHNFTENNYIHNVDEITNFLINDISQHNFTENNYINNLEFEKNDFIDKIKDNNQSLEKEKCEIKKIDKENIFNIGLKKKIDEIKSNLKLSSKTDYAILFLYVQYFVLDVKISNSEMIREINILFKFEQFSNAYYSQISNELFEWKENNSKIKSVNNVLNGSSYYEKFNDIMLSFKNLN